MRRDQQDRVGRELGVANLDALERDGLIRRTKLGPQLTEKGREQVLAAMVMS